MNNKALPQTMKAAVAARYGGPEVIEIREVPLPELKPGMVLVKVKPARSTRATPVPGVCRWPSR